MVAADISQKSFEIEARIDIERTIGRNFNFNDSRLDLMRDGFLDVRHKIKRRPNQERKLGCAPYNCALHDAHSSLPFQVRGSQNSMNLRDRRLSCSH